MYSQTKNKFCNNFLQIIKFFFLLIGFFSKDLVYNKINVSSYDLDFKK